MKTKLKFDELNRLDYFEPMQISADDKEKRRELSDYLIDAFLFFFALFEVNQAHKEYADRITQGEYYEKVLAAKISDAVTNVTGIDSYMSKHINELSKQVVETTIKNTEKKQEVKPGTPPQKTKDHKNPLITPALLINSDAGSLLSPYDSGPFGPEVVTPVKADTETDTGATKAIKRAAEREQELADEDDDLDNYWLSYRRAEDIAKSEANSFLNYTDFVTAKERGATKKTWLTMLDDKVRNTHEEVEGQTIGIDENFTVGKSLMKFPHDLSNNPDPKEVINCRCAVMYD